MWEFFSKLLDFFSKLVPRRGRKRKVKTPDTSEPWDKSAR